MTLPKVLAALAFAFAASVQAAEITRQEVVLLQPDAELRARVPSVDVYGDYVNAVRSGWFATIQAHALPQPTAGFLVLAVRPGQQSRLWLDFEPALPNTLVQALNERVMRTLPPVVHQGPVLIALKLSLDGAPWPAKMSPEPLSWRQAVAVAGEAIESSDLAQALWERPDR